MKLLVIASLAIALGYASATCPNLCNGHGTCGESDRCECFGNWRGADCSERVCNYGLAWVDAPSTGEAPHVTAANTAHWYAECSNKGICDRSTGLCECFDGYTGKGCRRSTCPNDCSGHGTCYYIEQLRALDSKFIVDYEATPVIDYRTWDKSKIQACVCDPYYEGTDCSLRQCPRGDNILTLNDVSTVQKININDATDATFAPSGQITITYTDLYGGDWTTRPITIDGIEADGVAIANALKALPNQVIESVTCAWIAEGTTGSDISCTFDSTHNAGVQNLLKVNIGGCQRAGCAPIYTGLNTNDGEHGIAVTVTDTTAANTHKEAKVCSEHGLCDTETGLCNCFSGYYDEDCSQQTVLV